MNQFSQPLSQSELEQLDAFLLNRCPEENDSPDHDEGILGISELDGFLTAIICAPEVVLPSQWLDCVWADEPPVFSSKKQAEAVVNLIMRHINTIASQLKQPPEDYWPLFEESMIDGELFYHCDDWCEGFLRGMGLTFEQWENFEYANDLLHLMILFGSDIGDKVLNDKSLEDIREFQEMIPLAVLEAYQWGEKLRLSNKVTEPENVKDHLVLNIADHPKRGKIGRNDPCPCGSGKKFKKCCAMSSRRH